MHPTLAARDKIVQIIESTFPELTSKVERYKRDTVALESLPTAVVYVDGIESNPVAGRGHVERTTSIAVELHRRTASVEDVLLHNAEQLERAVYAERQSFDSAVKRIYLSRTQLATDPQQKNVGSVIIIFSLSTQAELSS